MVFDILAIVWVMLVIVILHGCSRNIYISICCIFFSPTPLILWPLKGLDKYFYNWLRKKDILLVVAVRLLRQVSVGMIIVHGGILIKIGDSNERKEKISHNLPNLKRTKKPDSDPFPSTTQNMKLFNSLQRNRCDHSHMEEKQTNNMLLEKRSSKGKKRVELVLSFQCGAGIKKE